MVNTSTLCPYWPLPYWFSDDDKDPKLAEVKKVIKIYKTPPPVPKRADSIACNIEKYFNTDLIKKGEQDDEENMELIEERILSEDVNCDTDDQFEVISLSKIFSKSAIDN